MNNELIPVASISEHIKKCTETKALLNMLKRMGRLPHNFDASCLIDLLNSKSPAIRFYAIKNLGKLIDSSYLLTFKKVATEDSDSMVRREAISSIGRLKSNEALDFLIKTTNDKDPKIVMQAIRALFYFKSEPTVKSVLISLKNHPNEIIRSVIDAEFNGYKEEKSAASHPHVHGFLKNIIVEGNVLDALKYVPSNSIHLTFTSPPYYNAKDYSIYQSYEQYIEFLSKVFKEVQRVTKNGRYFILNTSPIIIPRFSRKHASRRYPIPFDIHSRLTKEGWDFIDDIIWVKPEASVKNRNGGFMQHRKPLAYKPNLVVEYVMVYRKTTNRLIDWNIRQYPEDVISKSKINEDYETTNVWKIDPVFDKVHSAVFPEELCRRVIKYYSYEGDIVFDPFAGSGTFGKVALDNNRFFFLAESNENYIKRICEKISDSPIYADEKPKAYNIREFKEFVDESSR